jgi:hypothetical protein
MDANNHPFVLVKDKIMVAMIALVYARLFVKTMQCIAPQKQLQLVVRSLTRA